MAEIEHNDFFMVKRGPRLGKANSRKFYEDGESWKDGYQNNDDEPRYDRSCGGLIFKALEVDDCFVVCMCVYSTDKSRSPYQMQIGERMIFNTKEVELWPVQKSFLLACGISMEDLQRMIVDESKEGIS